MYSQLNRKQTEIANNILASATNNVQERECYFVEGPGRTGKTFLYKTLYYILTGRNRQVQCMAFTGIALILLPQGQTIHKTFGLNVPLSSDSKSNI